MPGVVLLIEDEADLVTTIEYTLRSEGYQVRVAGTAHDGLLAATSDPPPDVIVLDLGLPDFSGLELCRRLRSHDRTRETPVIICTAKGDEVDRIVGFEVGADDYCVKPVAMRELVLRIRALTRRALASHASSVVRFERLMMDHTAHRAWVDDHEIDLTAIEFRLLGLLMARRGRVQTREELLSEVWGIQAEVTTRTVDTHIKRLREKLGDAGSYIETLRGIGYRMSEQVWS